jgi:hypothetical protein
MSTSPAEHISNASEERKETRDSGNLSSIAQTSPASNVPLPPAAEPSTVTVLAAPTSKPKTKHGSGLTPPMHERDGMREEKKRQERREMQLEIQEIHGMLLTKR